MAYSINLKNDEGKPSHRFFPHILYHSGRILTYTFIGAVFGFLGQTTKNVLAVYHLQDFLLIFAGIVMILLGFELTGLFPALRMDKLPIMRNYQKFVRRAIQNVNTRNIFFLGLVLGFIPCGPVYIAGTVSASTGSVISGALSMAAFGIGTFPVLSVFGLSANLISLKFRNIILKFTAIVVIIFGVWTITKGIQKWNHTPQQHHECCGTEVESAD